MSKSGVRLRYSGFILFLSRLFGVGTGLLFTLMVTRNLSAAEFGIYNNLNDILSYFTLASGIIPFWTTRFVARKHPSSSKTGLTANLLVSLPFFIVYLSLVSIFISIFQIDEKYLVVYAFAAIQIIELHAFHAFEAILQAKRPQMLGFGFLISEITKVSLGFLLIIQFRLSLIGIVASLIFAFFLQILFYLKQTLSELHERVKWHYVKEWLKASPINFYGAIGQRLLSFTLFFLFVYVGELSRAYYAAALTIASMIGYSSLLAYALYPRLLSEDRPDDVYASFKMVLMVAMPMTIGAIVLSDPFLIILSPIYLVAKISLVLLSLNYLCLTFSSIFDTVVMGTEKMDADAKISYRHLIRSRLFLLFTLPYVQTAIVLPLTYYVLTTIVTNAVEGATFLALITLIANIAMTVAKYAIAKRSLDFHVPWSSMSKYLGASVLMALALYLLPSPTRVSTTLAMILIGVSVYFLSLLAVDKESRKIAKFAMQKLWSTLGVSSG